MKWTVVWVPLLILDVLFALGKTLIASLFANRIWGWYINDFRTRLVPGAAEILILNPLA